MEGETAENGFLRRQNELRPLMPNVSAEQFMHAEQIIQQALAQAAALQLARNTDNPEQDLVERLHADDVIMGEIDCENRADVQTTMMPDEYFNKILTV